MTLEHDVLSEPVLNNGHTDTREEGFSVQPTKTPDIPKIKGRNYIRLEYPTGIGKERNSANKKGASLNKSASRLDASSWIN